MLHRDPAICRDWTARGPAWYVPVQREILEAAARLLAPGGLLMYSTCTFSEEENEDNLEWFLGRHSEFSPVPAAECGFGSSGPVSGRCPGTWRLWPHKLKGEGHFLALCRKAGEPAGRRQKSQPGREAAGCSLRQLAPEFAGHLDKAYADASLYEKNGSLYLLPAGTHIRPGIRYVRTGLLCGTLEKGRFVPSQALAMALKAEEYDCRVDFSWEDERVLRYLKGESIDAADYEPAGNGWILICAGGKPLGWAKGNSSLLKNKYYPGWRWQ